MQLLLSNIIKYTRLNFGVLKFLQNKRIILPSLFIVFYLLLYFFIDFSSQSLVAHDEGLYARRARLLEYSDNWFSPPFAIPHHKTLGSYWFIALSIKIFGNSELALRLPSILASFICLFISYLIASKITNRKAAFISTCSLSSMPLWIQYSRYASPDILFVLCTLLVIYFFLKALDSTPFAKQYFYIFFSGLFISSSFFIRSFMAFVPLIGLSPFLLYHLIRKDFLFNINFLGGMLFGSIPTALNFYFSFQKYGIVGITSLFDFAKKQAIGGFRFDDFLLIPLNFLYFTFPVGLLIVILYIFNNSDFKVKYPLLTYCFPLISLVVLMSMSTSYPHYYLFLLPFLSNLFAVYLISSSFNFTSSKIFIRSILFLCMILLSSILLFFVINFKEFLINYANGRNSLIYIVTLFLLLSYLSSIRFLLGNKYSHLDLKSFFYNIVIPQYISLSLLYNNGILGNPNYNTKSFLNDQDISSITSSNTIYLFSVDSKIQTLLSYYLPSSKVVNSLNDFSNYKYLITSDSNYSGKFSGLNGYKSIKTFDNHLLLMDISN